jgi:hypothetical protein
MNFPKSFLKGLTAKQVLGAIREYDRMTRRGTLDKEYSGHREPSGYVLWYADGFSVRYACRRILRVAYFQAYGQKPDRFGQLRSGQERVVLKKLGFSVPSVNKGGRIVLEHDPSTEFEEGKRLKAERYFFSRNRALAEKVKRDRNFTCEVCGFRFELDYGTDGSQYIEAHHKSPLSERPKSDWAKGTLTDPTEIVCVCSNCHRMLHRQIPAMKPEVLKKLVQAAWHRQRRTRT